MSVTYRNPYSTLAINDVHDMDGGTDLHLYVDDDPTHDSATTTVSNSVALDAEAENASFDVSFNAPEDNPFFRFSGIEAGGVFLDFIQYRFWTKALTKNTAINRARLILPNSRFGEHTSTRAEHSLQTSSFAESVANIGCNDNGSAGFDWYEWTQDGNDEYILGSDLKDLALRIQCYQQSASGPLAIDEWLATACSIEVFTTTTAPSAWTGVTLPVSTTNLLRSGANFLSAQRKAHMAETVLYTRGGSSVQVQATLSKTDFEQQDQYGMTVGGEITDFLLNADDLKINGVVTLPAYGDEIQVYGRGTFEVLNLNTDGVYRFSDPFGQTLRIHTKFIG